MRENPLQRRHADPDGDTVVTRLRAAVADVDEPELHLSLGELDLVSDVAVGRGGRARLVVNAVASQPAAVEELTRRLEAVGLPVPGVHAVQISIEHMNEPQRMAVAQKLRAHGKRHRDADHTAVYAVASGKGGVGKSSVSANLAVSLARAGRRVGLIDADVWGYSVPQLFGVRTAPVALKGLMLPVESCGVRLMSVGFFVAEDEPVVWRGPMLHKALAQFVEDVYWGELDVLILDLPPGTGDVALSLLELLPQAALVAVTTPQRAARAVAERLGRLALDMRMPVAGVVENMSPAACPRCGELGALFGEGGGRELADALGTSLLGQVPLDPALREAGDDGTPLVVSCPGSPAARELMRIAGTLPRVRRSLVGAALPISVA